METQKKCESCEGTGQDLVSCCNDDIRDTDSDLCPTCKEHTGGECYDCQGSGIERTSFKVSLTAKKDGLEYTKVLDAYGETFEEAQKGVKEYLKRWGFKLIKFNEFIKN